MKLTIFGDDNLLSDWRCEGSAESWCGCIHGCRVGLGLDGRGRPSLRWQNGRRGKTRLYGNFVGAGGRDRLGGVSAPIGDFFQTFSAGMLEESDFVAGVFEFVDVSPDFRLPRCLMGRSLAATGAAGVKGDAWLWRSLDVLQFEKDAAHFFDLFVRAHDVLVAQKVSKAEFAGFDFRFFAGVERAVFGSQLLGRVARHPENVFVSHAYLSLGLN